MTRSTPSSYAAPERQEFGGMAAAIEEINCRDDHRLTFVPVLAADMVISLDALGKSDERA